MEQPAKTPSSRASDASRLTTQLGYAHSPKYWAGSAPPPLKILIPPSIIVLCSPTVAGPPTATLTEAEASLGVPLEVHRVDEVGKGKTGPSKPYRLHLRSNVYTSQNGRSAKTPS